MAVLSFFCDESGKYRKNPIVAISGIGAERSRLDSFNDQWRALLRAYQLLPELHMSRALDLTQANGPKMPAGQSLDERIEALVPFADCINEHLEIGLAQAWDVKGYANLSLEVKKNLGGSHDPYQLAFVRGLLAMHQYAGPEDVISIYCDDDPVTAWDTYLHYRNSFKAVPEIAKYFVGISFAKSEHFSPLQAADMVAFLTRREATARFWQKPNEYKALADYLMAGPKAGSQSPMQWYTAYIDEQNMVSLANAVLSSDQTTDTHSQPGLAQAGEGKSGAVKSAPS